MQQRGPWGPRNCGWLNVVYQVGVPPAPPDSGGNTAATACKMLLVSLISLNQHTGPKGWDDQSSELREQKLREVR